MNDELLDARGVLIEPGDTAIYGFGVSRSVAMAEAVVLGEHRPSAEPLAQGEEPLCTCGLSWGHPFTPSVSLTPSGRVRLRVVRRSYASGEKPVVDVAPDRLVVLKHRDTLQPPIPYLPPSPLPTQDEVARQEVMRYIALYVEDLRKTEAPSYWAKEMPRGSSVEAILADYHAWCSRQLAKYREKLKDLDGS